MNNKIVTILGSGFLNKYLVRLLNKKNYRCIISTRTPFQKGYLKTQATPGAIELIEWNPNNFSQLKESIKNSDVVINLIGILYETRKQKFMKIHRDIPEAVAKICAQSDVKKFINISAIGASENSKSLYQRSKFQGEVKALTNFKNTVIIRPSVIEGAESNFSNLFAKLSFFPIIPILNKSYNFQPILVSDVADAIVKAIEAKDNYGKIYEIGGPKIISFEDMIKSILRTKFNSSEPPRTLKLQKKSTVNNNTLTNRSRNRKNIDHCHVFPIQSLYDEQQQRTTYKFDSGCMHTLLKNIWTLWVGIKLMA